MENGTNKVITRFPPSPTGYFHVGSVRTALFNYLFARQRGGTLVLRIEDTDRERSRPEYETDIIESLAWLGLTWDGDVFRQSERGAVYSSHLKRLVDSGAAYVSREEPKEEGRRAEVIRFRNPGKAVTFTDLIRGEVTMDTSDLGDFVIAKSMEEPVYHLAVVVDDHESGVTHIIRGEDHVSNTPRHILLQEALGFPRPVYAHLPLILAEDRSKLSKRKHGERVSLKHYIDEGYLRDAIVNYMALLGWNPGTEQEIFTLDELVQAFDISKVQKGGAVFSDEKLKWINRQHMLRLPAGELEAMIAGAITGTQRFEDKGWRPDKELLAKVVKVVAERISVLSEAKDIVHKGELDFFFEEPQYEPSSLVWKDSTKEDAKRHIEHVIDVLSNAGAGERDPEAIKALLWDYATEQGRGSVLWPVRFALSGREKSPDPFTLISILGTEASVARLRSAVQKLQ